MLWIVVGPATGLPPGTIYQGDCQPGDRAASAAEVVAASPTPPPAPYSFLRFMALFTSAEQAAIVGATDAATRLFLLKSAASDSLDLADAGLKAILDAFVTQGILTGARETAVLAGQAVPTS